MKSVSFIDTPHPVAADVTCPICMDHDGEVKTWLGKKADYFIVHEGDGGDAHPMHRECVKQWIAGNATCPTCRVPIKNRLVSPFQAAGYYASSTMEGATMGAKVVGNINVFGVTATITAAGLILGGAWMARDCLALTGASHFASAFGGILGRFTTNRSGAESSIGIMAPVAATVGAIAIFPALLARQTQDARFLYGCAGFGFISAAGYGRTAVAATIGAVSHIAKAIFLNPGSWDKFFTVASGGLGTFVNGFKSNWEFNVLPALAGMRASHWAYDQYGSFKSAVIGCVTSGVLKSILIKAFGEEQRYHRRLGPAVS